MYKIAIVEDDQAYASTLSEYIRKFGEEKNLEFTVKRFTNPVSFLEPYAGDYDLIFMDIQMPYMNGMDAAHRLREIDKNVALIFVTSLGQYAINGYEVRALDFILKPIGYFDFVLKMSRAMQQLPEKSQTMILVNTRDGVVKLSPSDLTYAESKGHHVLYHMKDGTTYEQYASLKSVEKELSDFSFARMNSCYLVNLSCVDSVKGYTAVVYGEELQISQPKKKSFMNELMEYSKKNAKRNTL